MVITATGTTVEAEVILELAARDSNPKNPLAALAYGADITKFTLTRSGKTFTFYGVIESYDEDLSRGAGVAHMNINMVDTGAANPGYA